MESEMVKCKPLTKEETKALLDFIEASPLINTKATNASNNKLKVEEWTRIAARFNATASTCTRTAQQLRLKWENLKKNSRKRSTKIRMNNIQTGVGAPDYIPPDEILDRVASLLGSTGTGFSVPFGGDSEMEVVFVEGDVPGGGGDPIDGFGGGDRITTDEEESADQPVSSKPPTLNSFPTPRTAGKRKITSVGREARNARDRAIAEYYQTKKKCVELQCTLLQLQIDNEKKKKESS